MSLIVKKRNIVKDGKRFFYLADTCWSAFTNIEDYEWEYYLSLRKQQGFNTLQINILPQWDASESLTHRTPFVLDQKGDIDFTKLNTEYFERSRKMCIKAKEYGFELALVTLWCNYIPTTWASRMPHNKFVLPLTFLEMYSEVVHKYFGDITSLYMISGDTDFSDVSTEYYLKMSKLMRNLDPEILQTMHIKGRLEEVPNEIVEVIDLYFYQSGHNSENRAMPYLLAETFYNNYPVKPIINSEPCYEQMGYSRQVYGRWSQRDVRQAAWQSVLSGAYAGVTYGASGIYSWHRINVAFEESIGEAFDKPNAWNDALTYPGAWDYGFIKNIFEIYNIVELEPASNLLLKDKPGVRLARSEDILVIYIPHNTEIILNEELHGYYGYTYNLSNRQQSPTELIILENKTIIKQHIFFEDVAIILIKEKK